MAEVKVDGKSAHYTTGGKGWEEGLPFAVGLHGAGLSQASWVLQSRALAHHGWNVAALDLPGHGTSEDAAELTTIEDYARWVAAFMSAIGVERAALYGHSLGAAIALTLGAESPGRVTALVLLGVASELPVNGALLDSTEADTPRAVDMITAFSYDRGHHLGGCPAPGTWLMGGSRALLARCGGAVLHRDYAAANSWSGAGYVARLTCPTLVLAGSGDRMVAPAKGRRLAGAIAGARFEEFPGAGHDLMSEAPRAVLKSMRAFLDPLARPAGE